MFTLLSKTWIFLVAYFWTFAIFPTIVQKYSRNFLSYA